MHITNIQNYELKGGSTHYSLEIIDQAATIEQIEELLQKVEFVERLIIDSKISRIPKRVKEVVQKTLILRTKSNLRIEESSLPLMLEGLTIQANTIDHIPELVWQYGGVNITAQKISRQLSDPSVPTKTINANLEIWNLKNIPNIPLNYCTIKSQELIKISDEFFSLNKDCLSVLRVDCNQLEVNQTSQRLNILRTFLLKTKEELSDTTFSFLPATISSLEIIAPKFDMDFTKFKQLNSLFIQGLETKSLDLESNSLSMLTITKSKIASFDKVNLPNLNRLTINETLDAVPSFVFKSIHLQSLFLNKNRIQSIPADWSLLSSLSQFSLAENEIVFDNFDFAYGIQNLKSLHIYGNNVRNKYVFLTPKILPFYQGRLEELLGCESRRVKDVLRFASAVSKAKIKEEEKRHFLDAYVVNPNFTNSITTNEVLLAAFKINFQELKLFLNTYLNSLIEKRPGMDSIKGAVVYIDGTGSQSKTRMKELLEQHGAKLARSWSKSVTHVLFGKKPTKLESFSNHIKYISEQEISALEESEKFINVQVNQGNDTVLENVNALLLSADPANVLIGMNMLETGGVHEEFLRSLLVIAKANPDAKVRKEAKKLLTIHGPKEWALLLESKLLFKGLNKNAKEQDTNKKLAKLSQEVGIDLACETSLALFERFRKGLRFMLTRSRYPDQYKRRLYDLLCPKNHFDLAAGIGFRNWKDKDPKDIIFNTYKIKMPMHGEILNHKKVTSICLHNAKLAAIPKDLNQFKDLKVLDLSCNNIAKIPGYFGQLKQLEELDLSMNIFETFPSQLLKMPQLRKIDFRYNRNKGFMGSFSKLEIPEEAKEALPKCEILS